MPDNLFEQLRDLTKSWNAHQDIPQSQQRECRALGEKLYALGGGVLMQQAYYDAKGANPNVHVIQAYWDGIGDWRW